MGFKPAQGKLLVKKIDQPNMSKGGITLPESAVSKHVTHGKVLEVGPGKFQEMGGCLERVPLTAEVGDHVVFHVSAGLEIKLSGEDFLVVEDENLLGVVSA